MISEAIVQLGAFFKNGEVGKEIRPAVDLLGTERVRVASIFFFKWLSTQGSTGSKRELILLEGAEWSQSIRDLLNVIDSMSEVFSITGNQVNFVQDVHEIARDEIRLFACNVYQPKLLAGPRPPRPVQKV